MEQLDSLRNKMDEITLHMIQLLKERTEIAKEIGSLKQKEGLFVTDENREEILRQKVNSLSKEIQLDKALSNRFLNVLFNESIKVQNTSKTTHLAIFAKAKKLESEGKKIIHMEVGEPDFQPPKIVEKALEEIYKNKIGNYGSSRGLETLRKEISKKIFHDFGISVGLENLIISPGGRFSVFSCISTLLNPGDELIIIEPSWPAYRDCALHTGVKIRTIKTTLEKKWIPSIDEIKSSINENTKMIVLNYPNNPTGKILPEDVQDQLMRIVKDNDLYVLSDEIYSYFSFVPWKSILSYNYSKSIIIQSLSKSHAMTGYRIGFTIADKKIIEKLEKFFALCLTNISEPIQYVALKALQADTSENSKKIHSRLQKLKEKAREMNLDFIEPEGAMYIFAKVRDSKFDGRNLCEKLLDHGVALAPGEGFGDYREFIRISACQEEKKLMEGMDILDSILKEKEGK